MAKSIFIILTKRNLQLIKQSNNMKHRIGLLLFFTLLCGSSLSAQESESTPLTGDLDFLSVKDVKIQTTAVYQDDALVHWNEEGLHVGVQAMTFTLFNNRDIPRDFEMPENPTYYFNIMDMTGKSIAGQEDDMTSLFKKIKYTKKFSSLLSSSVTVKRGGEYKVRGGISPDLFTFEKTIVLPEEAGTQISNTTMAVDSLLVPTLYITSGYPYNPTEISGEKYLRWTLVAAATPTEKIADKEEKFELLSELPSLAAIAEINIEIPELQPGEYLLTLLSDYEPANRIVKLFVKDILDIDITLDKEEYTLGVDKEIDMHIEMRYGYPYIKVDQETNKPTVNVLVDLLGEKTTEAYSDEAWENSEMSYSGIIKVGLDKLDKEQIEEYKGEIPMTVTVSFNDATQYSATIDIPFVPDESGIGNLIEENSTIKGKKQYSVFGVEVEDTYRGLVITSDGKKIIKF